jgi:hypothetical protein
MQQIAKTYLCNLRNYVHERISVNYGLLRVFYLIVSTVLTYVGFFIESVPYYLAYTPFILALLDNRKKTKFFIGLGHFLIVGIICGYGLFQLGYALPMYFIIAVIVPLLCAYVFAIIGIGLTSLILVGIPFFPANPLLVAGIVWPQSGFLGLLILPVFIALIESLRRIEYRALLSMCIIIIPALVLNMKFIQTIHNPTFKSVEINTSNLNAVSERGRWDITSQLIKPNKTYVFGENYFERSSQHAFSYWCRIAKQKSADLYIGVRNSTGVGEVYQFNAQTCPSSNLIYRAEVGIPTITGSWTIQSHFNETKTSTEWLICFEAFSILRWIIASQNEANNIIIISNDAWTDPLNVPGLRRKVSASLARLFHLNIHLADTYQNILETTDFGKGAA